MMSESNTRQLKSLFFLLFSLFLASCSSGSPSPENLIQNPGFEDQSVSWGTFQSTVQRVQGGAHQGNWSLEVKASPGQQAYSAWQELKGKIIEGKAYIVTGWVKGQGGAIGQKLCVLAREAGGSAPFEDGESCYTLTGEWQPVSSSRTISPGRTILQVHFFRPNQVRPDDVFLMDDMHLREID